MRPVSRFASAVRRCALFVFAVAVFITTAAQAQTYTFTGKVYSPLGPSKGDPIPNIFVFVQDINNGATAKDPGFLPVFTPGVTIPPSGTTDACSVQQNLLPKTLLGSGTTDGTGTYSFNVTGQLPSTVNVVIQAGKWRRQYPFPLATIQSYMSGTKIPLPALTMPPGKGNPVDSTLPAITTTADLPQIAVVTGSADEIECIFPQLGINSTGTTSEITNPGGTGSINLFQGTGSAGVRVDANTPAETDLVSPTGTYPMTNYDLVIFGCQGGYKTDTPAFTAANDNYMTAYTGDGGRVLLTHYEYPWLGQNSTWSPLVTWNNGNSIQSAATNVSEPGQLISTYSGYQVLDAWMNAIGAFDINPATAAFSLPNARQDAKTINSAAVDAWAQVTDAAWIKSGSPVIQFSFDTPLGAAGQPVATVGFTNNQTNFLEGDPNDSIQINVTNTGTIATNASEQLTLTLSIPPGITPISLVDNSTGGWTCTLATGTCNYNGSLAAGASDSVLLSFSIPKTSPLGIESLVAGLTGGGLNQSSQCGRVLYNDYHVENPKTAPTKTTAFSATTCNAIGISDATKFLEYSLYSLSNFVSPANTDTFQIQASGVITWNIPTPLYYGTTLSQIEDATVNTPGTTTYTITPTPTYANDPTLTMPDANTFTVKASFVPNDIVDYLSTTMTKTVSILPDPTVSVINNLENSIFYGQEIGYDPTIPSDATLSVTVQPGLPNLLSTPSVVGGPYNVTIDGVLVCTGTEGQPPTNGNGTRCPDAGFLGWGAGQHAVILSYAGSTDFAASTGATQTVSIAPDPTTTTMSTTATGTGTLATNLSYAVTVADIYTTAIGTVTLYDSPTPVSGISSPTGTMVAVASSPTTNGAATLALSTLAVGTHNIVACFAAPPNAAGNPNMKSSCTSSIPQVVTPIPSPLLGTVTTLKSSTNPSPAGNAVTFTATIQTTGAFTTIPTGSVTFYDGTNPLGSATSVSATGTATYTSSSLTLGTHNITAVYAGSSTMATSTSAVLPEVIVNPLVSAGPDFLLLVNPVTVPVYVGSSSLVTVQVVAIGTFTSQVALTCTGLPAQSSCAFAQSTIQAGGGTTEMIVSSSAPHDCNQNDPYFSGMGGESMIGLLGLSTLTLCFARRRRKLQMVALAAVLLLLPSVLSGCGTSNCTDFGVKPGDYSFTLTATPSSSSITTKTQAMVMHVHL